MADGDANIRSVKYPQPRQLGEKETLQNLTAWWANLEVFYGRDSHFEGFMEEGETWRPDQQNFGFAAEVAGLRRTAANKARQLRAFLTLVSSYSSFPFLQVKLLNESTSWASVKKIILKAYGAASSHDMFLELGKLTKSPAETYLTFYERMADHVRIHLAPGNTVAGHITVPAVGDKMTVTLHDCLVVMWLQKIDSRLLDIVQTEFQVRLKGGTRLFELVETISVQIDQLLGRYEGSAGSVGRVQDSSEGVATSSIALMVDATVNRLQNSRGGNRNRDRDFKDRRAPRFNLDSSRKTSRERERASRGGPSDRFHCPYCEFLAAAFKVKVRADHNPSSCPNRPNAIRLMDASKGNEDQRSDEDKIRESVLAIQSLELEAGEDDGSSSSGIQSFSRVPCYEDILQTDEGQEAINRVRRSNVENSNLSAPERILTSQIVENKINSIDSIVFDDSWVRRIRNIVRSKLYTKSPRKAKSPTLLGNHKGKEFVFVVDSGAEISVLDENLARALKVKITRSLASAKAANKSPMELVGQTEEDFLVEVQMEQGKVVLDLGRVPVIRDLGCGMLLGEGAKADNKIVTYAHEKYVTITQGSKTYTCPYYIRTEADRKRFPLVKWVNEGENQELPTDYLLLRVTENKMLSPGEAIEFELPERMITDTGVVVTPRRSALSWIKAGYRHVRDKRIAIKNIGESSVKLSKNDHIADVRSCRQEVIAEVATNPDLLIPEPENEMPDLFQNIPLVPIEDNFDDNLQKINMDPDKTLSEKTTRKLWEVIEDFKHLFTDKPGKYNGRRGQISNNLQFAGVPPSNDRIRTPKYSKEMTDELARRMSELEAQGVLCNPEDIGVEAKFVSPSFLVPKEEKGKFRLVTDFSQLNTFLKKTPAVSPTISQTKQKLARKKYLISCDFSNFFYQSGLPRKFCQYVATIHPYEGTKVYTVLPQGMRGSSEFAYEKLTRIFADMVQEEKACTMADGLYIMAADEKELIRNWREALTITSECGLTLKPGKCEINPRSIKLFGWILTDGMWSPTPHVISSLASAEKPTTIKLLRSFVGAFKQITSCIPDYAVALKPLEQFQGGKSSAERIQWTKELEEAFEKVKSLAARPEHITTPRPEDKLRTYSDFSGHHRAGGGRLEVIRKLEDGSTVILPGGYYSVTFHQYKKPINPCDGEALCIRAVISHFAPYIIESHHETQHFTDNRPCVLAWKASQRGAFSSSVRMQAFLTGISSLPVQLVYKAGNTMQSSDYASRHPVRCEVSGCDVCSFVKSWEKVSDNSPDVRAISIQDVAEGRAQMPFTSRSVWKNIQDNDKAHQMLKKLIETGQLPPKKKTNNEYTRLKNLHSLYCKGKLIIAKDGLVLVKVSEDRGAFDGCAISVPSPLIRGVYQMCHLRLNHPGRTSEQKLLERYFYSPGGRAVLAEIQRACFRCESLRQLPPVLQTDTTSESEGFASKFSCDVIERNKQKIFVITECLTSLTRLRLIENQTAETLREEVLKSVLDLLSENGTTVRVDCHPSFQSLRTESADKNSILYKYNIKIETGRESNPNKNPVVERMNREIASQILRTFPEKKRLTDIDLAILERKLNSKIHYHGLSSREAFLRRDFQNNHPQNILDADLAKNQLHNRIKKSEVKLGLDAKKKKILPNEDLNIGDLCFERADGSKLQARQPYIVIRLEGEKIFAKRWGRQLRNKEYEFRPGELVRIFDSTTLKNGDNEELDSPATLDAPETKLEKNILKDTSNKNKKDKTDKISKRGAETIRRETLPRRAKEKAIPWTSLINKVQENSYKYPVIWPETSDSEDEFDIPLGLHQEGGDVIAEDIAETSDTDSNNSENENSDDNSVHGRDNYPEEETTSDEESFSDVNNTVLEQPISDQMETDQFRHEPITRRVSTEEAAESSGAGPSLALSPTVTTRATLRKLVNQEAEAGPSNATSKPDLSKVTDVSKELYLLHELDFIPEEESSTDTDNIYENIHQSQEKLTEAYNSKLRPNTRKNYRSIHFGRQ